MKKRASVVIITIALFSILFANINDDLVNTSSFSLLDHLCYVPDERDQHPDGVGTGCGNCWVWAGTGILEIALHVQCGIKDHLSIQYFTSCHTGTVDAPWACCGGNIQNFSDFYSAVEFAIPWSNTNAHWQDGYTTCGEETTVPCDTISTWPRYPITTCAVEEIPTHGVGQETAINNIKDILRQNRGVQFDFCVPCDPDVWDPEGFCDFWYNQSETAVWDPDWACGNEYYCITGHAVLCVGYNDDDPDNKYWIMLNSWGTTYDDDPGRPNGLFRMKMDMNYDCYLIFGPTQEEEKCFEWYTLDVTFDCAHDTIPGDVDGDGDVDSMDLFTLAAAYGTETGDDLYDERCDFDNDGYVDSADLFTLAANYGKIGIAPDDYWDVIIDP